MAETTPDNLAAVIEELRKEMATLSQRVAKMEQPVLEAPVTAPPPAKAPAAAPAPEPEAPSGVTEEELLAISAAIGAYIGVRVHIKQIRLISSRAWALEGRVSIQASHRLHG